MLKLNQKELKVVVDEVVNNIKEIEDNKSKELFEKSKNKDLFLNKIKEIKDLKSKLFNSINEIRKIEEEFKKENLNVFFNNKVLDIEKDFLLNLLDKKSDQFSLYLSIEKELVLKGINKKINVEESIKELVEKFK